MIDVAKVKQSSCESCSILNGHMARNSEDTNVANLRVSIKEGTPKIWFIMENPISTDDLGVTPFQETSIWIYPSFKNMKLLDTCLTTEMTNVLGVPCSDGLVVVTVQNSGMPQLTENIGSSTERQTDSSIRKPCKP